MKADYSENGCVLKDWKEEMLPTPALLYLADSQIGGFDWHQIPTDFEQSQGRHPLDGCNGAAEIRLNSR